MKRTITYENERHIPITEEQAQASRNFTKIIKIGSIIKCKEEFINGELWNVVFYQEGETIEEIFGQYPSLNGIDVVTRKEIQGDYIMEEVLGYLKNEGLVLCSFNIDHASTGRTICFGDYDGQTGKIRMETVMKIQYDDDQNIVTNFYYNNEGTIEIIEEVSREKGYNDYPDTYYNHVLPLFPEISTSIHYENEYSELITEEEALASKEFVKITGINGRTKIREDYENNLLIEVTYYQDHETIHEILNKYPLLDNIDIAKRTEIQGNYLKEETFTYHKNGELKLHTFNIEHHVTGKSICFGTYNLQTGEVNLNSVVKTKYDVSDNVSYTYYYNSAGEVYVFEEGDGGGFSNEFPESYYHYALPLFPEIENHIQ